MLPGLNPVMAFVTAPNMDTARRVARVILEERLAACVNIVPGLESHYWWQGKLEASAELMLVIKTRREKVEALEKCVRAHHPYEVPEFIAVDITAGSRPYLEWIGQSVAVANPQVA